MVRFCSWSLLSNKCWSSLMKWPGSVGLRATCLLRATRSGRSSSVSVSSGSSNPGITSSSDSETRSMTLSCRSSQPGSYLWWSSWVASLWYLFYYLCFIFTFLTDDITLQFTHVLDRWCMIHERSWQMIVNYKRSWQRNESTIELIFRTSSSRFDNDKRTVGLESHVLILTMTHVPLV